MKIPAENMGFETFEVTSSSMHSYSGEGWKNPLRLDGAFTNEFNFMIIDSKNDAGVLKVDIKSWGLKDEPYFNKHIEVKR
jgi:hypothetical protein